jgi:hypothetical protein
MGSAVLVVSDPKAMAVAVHYLQMRVELIAVLVWTRKKNLEVGTRRLLRQPLLPVDAPDSHRIRAADRNRM